MRRQTKKLICLVTIVLLLASTAEGASKKPATVKLTADDVVLEVTFKDNKKLTVTSKGTKLAPGTYFVKSMRLLKRDKQKRLWEMRSDGTLRTLATITVAAGQEKILDVTGKIHFDYFIWVHRKEAELRVLFRITAQGRYGEVYYPGAFLKKKRPPMPAYRITTMGGKVLAAGRLSHMSSGPGRYVWKVPPGLTQNCKIEIKPTMGPFEWKPSSRVFKPEQTK